ncbi:hypothetical protein [Roseomonas marmotae]|uniref:Uncharacterized protein n=1 Tax=Roseomonas marmotae TaxID=2768161 RepID=A0ABS3KJR9_9PROT|nr:hypothetical protein [Roseomonas marmotae]MBO1077252.1 hypothetical protein [Roseomonas marmotae]
MALSVMAAAWCGLAWSAWVPLERTAIRTTAPAPVAQYGVHPAATLTPEASA